MQAWENIAKIGTIVEVDVQNRALAKVNIAGRISDFFPVLHFANSFKRTISPIRVDEQVMVIAPYGEANGGFIIRGVFNTSCKEPNGWSDTKEVVEYEDGTTFSYDTSVNVLEVNCSGTINIVCQSASVVASSVSFSGDVNIGGNLVVGGTIADTKGDLTSHAHPNASAR